MKSRYHQLEEFVFNKLWDEYKETGNTFSVRQKASEGARKDYFIGKEQSRYLAFTYWNIPTPIRNPIDVTNFFFSLDETYYYYNFQFICQKNDQNPNLKTCLQLGKTFLETLNNLESDYEVKLSKPKSKDFLIRVIKKKAYSDFETLWSDFIKFREIISEKVNTSIKQVKQYDSEFFAELIGESDFKNDLIKLEKRVGRNMFESINNIAQSTKAPIMSTVNHPNHPLNQILYGPPGTGKTYSTVARAYEIAKGIKVTDENYTTAKTWFKSELAKEEDRQLDFITFHQNYSYEDFVMGLKPDLEGNGLSFTQHSGVFYQICQRALKNWKDSQKTIEVIEQEKSFEQLFEEFKDDILDKIEKSEKGRFDISKSAYINRIEEDAFIYTGDNWNQNGRMKFDDVIKIYQNPKATDRKEAKKTANISRTAIEHISYYYKVAETLREFSNKQKKEHHFVEKVILKNYVLVIDEINRANISRVFGELITLIEDDKRWGNEHEMEVRLPDGKTKFTVPKNLHIIGTMNTADKSIALLDIALRRRFEFVGLFPNKEKVVIEYQDFFEALNNAIKAKKGVDFMIGHAYFMNKENQAFNFKSAMNTKVIPLLNEYFYNPRSTDDVKKIINEAIEVLNKTSSTNKYEVSEENYQLIITEKNASN